jgi:hypothetical protein
MPSPRDVDVRDWLAGQALAGLLAAEVTRLQGGSEGAARLAEQAEDVAGRAWRIADAMLVARGPGAAGREGPGLDARIRDIVLQALREQELIE